MRSPILAYKATNKGLIPHDHETVSGKEFASANEALALIMDWVRDNPKKQGPENIVFVQLFDFYNSKP
jgi:hypothetical protein